MTYNVCTVCTKTSKLNCSPFFVLYCYLLVRNLHCRYSCYVNIHRAIKKERERGETNKDDKVETHILAFSRVSLSHSLYGCKPTWWTSNYLPCTRPVYATPDPRLHGVNCALNGVLSEVPQIKPGETTKGDRLYYTRCAYMYIHVQHTCTIQYYIHVELHFETCSPKQHVQCSRELTR